MAQGRGPALAWQSRFAARGVARAPDVALDVLLVLALAVPAGGLALRRGFDGLYGQDPYAYYDYAVGPLRTALLHLSPPPPFFWPPGYPLFVALASLVVGIAPQAGQLVSLTCGALAAVFTLRLAREVWPS